MIDTKIENCNNEILNEQKKNLIKSILDGTNSDHFEIVDIEAGCRKTRTAEEALAQLVKETDKNAIFVRLNNNDCKESADNINSMVGYNAAFAYNNNTVPFKERGKVQKQFPNYRILIITHEKYLVLAEDRSNRNIFTKNRCTLVIDEFVSDVKKLSLNKIDMNTLRVFFENDIEMSILYLKIIGQLEDHVTAYPTGRYFSRITPKFRQKDIDQLIKYIRSTYIASTLNNRIKDILSRSNLNNINIDLLKKMNYVKQLCSYIKNIDEFYKQTLLLENGTLYTTDSKCKHWLLDNNIMLDASGTLQNAYDLNNDLYHLENNPKVLDHSKWNIINIVVNTTSSSKEKITNFYEIVNDTIAKYGNNNTLVITNKYDTGFITNVPIENKGYFGNLTGSNRWADLANVVIAQTPNINDIDYILQYIHYSKKYIDEKIAKWTSVSTGRGITTKYEFTDSKFERIRTLWIAEQTYQAIKRVNRNMKYVTNAIIFMNNSEVIKLLQENLKGCSVTVIEENRFQRLWTKQDEYVAELQKKSYATKYLDLLAELQNGMHEELMYKDKAGNIHVGVYSKKSIRNYLGINKASIFTNKVLDKPQVNTYCKMRNIDASGQYIKLCDFVKQTA